MSKNKPDKPFYLKPTFYIIIILIVAIFSWQIFDFVGLFTKKPEAQKNESVSFEVPFAKQGELTILKNDSAIYTFNIEIANDDQKRAQGLMYRSSMAENEAMLFIFPKAEMQSFWMRNTRMFLDIIYIGENKEIVSIVENARPYDEISRPSEAPAQYVLEINGGLSKKLGITKGDTISFTSF